MHEKCLSEYDPKSPFPLKCVKNYHPDYDGMWVRDSTLKQEIVNLKEKFGTDLTKGMNDYLINVMVPNKEGISSEDLNYEEWGIKRGQKILPRLEPLLSFVRNST